MRCSMEAFLVSLTFALFFSAQLVDARTGPVSSALPVESVRKGLLERRFLFLVDSPEVVLEYHNGPVLTGSHGTIAVYLIWYGSFNATEQSAVRDFLGSFQGDNGTANGVSKWWNVTGGFVDDSGRAVAGTVKLAGEVNDTSYSMGKDLKNADIGTLVEGSLTTFPADPEGIYFVLTASDVLVEDFCMNSCASHFATSPSQTVGGMQLPYAWVGNPETQCPGMCAWPFAQPSYMPANNQLPLPPNGNIGADALIIQMAYMLAGTATNPFDNAYYQGDASVPLEAGTACFGFGVGAFNGYPGELQKDVITGAEYNAEGINDRKFLLPTLWDPATRKCTPVSSLP